MRRAAALCCALVGAAVCASQAAAYCYYNSLLWERDGDALEAIPVYLDFGPVGDLKRTGLSEATLISYTMTILEEHNRAAVTAPRLYFGGVRRPDHRVTASNSPDGAGIHIRAALCKTDDVDANDDGKFDDDPDATAIASRGDAGENKAVIRVRPLLDSQGLLCPLFEPWNTLGAKAIAGGITECEEPFPGVFHPSKGYCIPFKDFKGVVLHELLHTTGLHHHQLDTCECAKVNGTHSDDFVPTWGSVRTDVHVQNGSGRSLWRDDIEGLEAHYTRYGDAPQSWKVVEYASQTGATWDAVGVVPLAQQTTAPVAASSSTAAAVSTLVLAYAGEDRFVRAARRQGAGGPGAWDDLGAVDPDTIVLRSDQREVPAGVTYQRPAAAYAPANDDHAARIAVAWLFEDETKDDAQIRWGVRNLGGGAWTLAGQGGFTLGPIFVKPRIVNLGYDPVGDVFLITYLDDDADLDDPRQYGYVQALSVATGEKLGDPQLLRPISAGIEDGPGYAVPGGTPFREVLHDIGKAACHDAGSARCAIPVATSGPNGPCLGWYFGTRTGDGLGFATLERQIFCMRDWGLNDLGLDAGLPQNYVGSLVTWFLGLDPVAEPPPQSFDCASEDLCAAGAITEARVRYRITGTSSGGLDQVTTQGQALGFDLSQPFAVDFVPGTSFAQPGPPDPGPWWPAAVGSLGVAGLGNQENRPFRIFVTEVEQRCGNGVAEPGEECDGNDLRGNSCVDIGLGVGDLACGRSCRYDRSDCSPPGCEGGPGEPNCECLPVSDSPFCDIDEDGCFADGPGSFVVAGQGDGLTCLDSFEGLAVCVFKKFGGPLIPVCQLCPDSPGNGQAGYGCPCDRDSDCAPSGQAGPTSLDFSGPIVPLGCFGSSTEQHWAAGPGVCLPKIEPGGNNITSAMLYGSNAVEEFERTRWLCKANCNALEERTNLDYACLYDQQPGLDFFNAACVDVGSCAGLVAGECEEMGRRCDPTLLPEQCVDECTPNQNGPNGNPTCAQKWGYPPGYQCTENWQNPPRCVPAACAQSPLMTGLDLSWCEQFVNGGG
jgi:hypothetical protein